MVITENTDGHVSDQDAAKIDYDDLLSQMKSDTQQGNRARTEAGYDAVTLVGRAEAPSYDPAQHSMVWAKDVIFGDATAQTPVTQTPVTQTPVTKSSHHSLNYAVRVLGRQDVLELNAVGSSEQLAQIRAGMRSVLPAVQFTAGNRYQDFSQGTDKLATYRLAGLIAGGLVAQKVGLFGVILLLLKKFWIVIVGGLALLRRVSGGLASGRASRAERPAGQGAPTAPLAATPAPATFPVHPDLLPRVSLSKADDERTEAENGHQPGATPVHRPGVGQVAGAQAEHGLRLPVDLGKHIGTLEHPVPLRARLGAGLRNLGHEGVDGLLAHLWRHLEVQCGGLDHRCRCPEGGGRSLTARSLALGRRAHLVHQLEDRTGQVRGTAQALG